jgi:putative ABC transport system ATP-binding protein
MRTASVVMEGLGKRYDGGDDAWAVRDVELSIYPREVTALVGPSGSGKTTLLSIVGCILAPTCGSLTLLDQDAHAFEEHHRQQFRRHNIGFVFQSYNLLASLTAKQNVELALSLRASDQSPLQLLDSVGLKEKAASYAAQLSGGQRQRVAIARALAGDPAFLLADEPTAALDVAQGRRVMELLQKRAHESGTTVIVVTHDARMLRFADRVIELEDGAIRKKFRQLREKAAPVPTPVSEKGRHAESL